MRQWITEATYLPEIEAGIDQVIERCKLDRNRREKGEKPIVSDFMLSPIKDGECFVFCITPQTTVNDLSRLLQTYAIAYRSEKEGAK